MFSATAPSSISAAEGFTFESIKLAIVALGPKFENTQSLYSPALISSSSDVTIWTIEHA